MKILISSTKFLPFKGGIENSIDALSKEFAKMGHEVTILVSDLVPDGLSEVPLTQSAHNIEVKRYHKPQVKGWMQVTGILWQMINIWRADNQKYDLVICRDLVSGASLFNKNRSAFRIYIAPGSYKHDLLRVQIMRRRRAIGLLAYFYNRYWKFAFNFFLEKTVVSLADSCVAWSMNLLNELGYRPLHKKWKQIDPGVNLSRFSLANIDTCNSSLRLLMICRFDPVKNIEDAIRSVQLCSFPVHLKLYGQGPDIEYLKDLAAQLNVRSKVDFAGETAIPEKVYPKADFFLMLSRYESFGQTMIEAMACGVPVIGYRPGGEYRNAVAEVVMHNVDGYIIAPSPKALAQKLAEVNQQTSEQRSIMRSNARKKIEQRYTWSCTVRSLIGLSGDNYS